MPKIRRALFVGRFQPFHKGHLAVLRKLLREYPEVIVVIGSAESAMTAENPFTAGERIEMIRACFSPEQLGRLILVPLRDINNHDRWVSHVRSHVPAFRDVYSNNDFVALLFGRQGMAVKRFPLLQRKTYQGVTIRKKMLEGKKWKDALPAPVIKYLQKIGGVARLQEAATKPLH